MSDGDKQSPRKIIQVALISDGESETLYALCDDGTIQAGWWFEGHFRWKKQLPPIPQDEVTR